MRKKKRIIAAAMALVILAVIALSACVTVLEATHDCTGADCEVCRLIRLIYSMFRTFCYAAAVMLLYSAARIKYHRRSAASTLARFSTPVTEKVRLLN